MRKCLSVLLVAAVMMVCLMKVALAADVDVKAVLFDNETGGHLTTKTQNIGVRIIFTNNTQSPLQLNNINLGRLQLTPMKIAVVNGQVVPNSDISWPLNLMNPYGNYSIAIDVGLSSALAGTILPMNKAILEPQPAPAISVLESGYYFPFLMVTATKDGQTHVYSATKEPIEVESVATKTKQ